MPQPTGARVADVTAGGQDPSGWAARRAAAPSRTLDDLVGASPGRDRLVVVSAHPDDETIGAGRLLSAWWRTRGPVHAVLATAGEACVDHVGARPADLAARRLAEWRGALGALGVEPATVLGLPDGDLAAYEDVLAQGLVDAVADLPTRPDRVVLLAPHPDDPHPDHQAAGRAAARAAEVLGAPLWGYPVWLTYWTDPTTPLGGALVRVALDPVDDEARTAGLAWFTSQTEPLAPGWGPVVPPGLLDLHDDQLLVLPDGSLR